MQKEAIVLSLWFEKLKMHFNYAHMYERAKNAKRPYKKKKKQSTLPISYHTFSFYILLSLSGELWKNKTQTTIKENQRQ